MDILQPSSPQRPSTTKRRPLPNLVDIQAVSNSFGISMRQVRRFVAEGQIPFVRVGGLIRFDPDELNHWIDARRSAMVGREPVSSSGQGQPEAGGADP